MPSVKSRITCIIMHHCAENQQATTATHSKLVELVVSYLMPSGKKVSPVVYWWSLNSITTVNWVWVLCLREPEQRLSSCWTTVGRSFNHWLDDYFHLIPQQSVTSHWMSHQFISETQSLNLRFPLQAFVSKSSLLNMPMIISARLGKKQQYRAEVLSVSLMENWSRLNSAMNHTDICHVKDIFLTWEKLQLVIKLMKYKKVKTCNCKNYTANSRIDNLPKPVTWTL